MTAVTDRPDQTTPELQQIRNRNRLLSFTVAALALIVVGLGGWIIYNQTTGPSIPAEIDQLIDDYLLAWEERDAEAIRATATQDFVINEYIYIQGRDLQNPERVFLSEHVADDIEGVISDGFDYAWETEQLGDRIITGEGPWFVSVEENWVQGNAHYDGIANYVVIDDDGTLKIANHYWAGLNYWTEIE